MEDQTKGEIKFEKIFIVGIAIIIVLYIGYHLGKSVKHA